MAKVITKDDVQAAADKAAAKATAAEKKRSAAAVKALQSTLLADGQDKAYVRGVKAAIGAAVAAIKTEATQ